MRLIIHFGSRRFAIFTMAAMLLCAAHASASSTLSISSTIRPGTCDHDLVGGKAIAMPRVDAHDFSNVMDGALPSSETPFDIQFTRCAGVSTINLDFRGDAAPEHADQFANTGDAAGVALHLRDRDDNPISATGASRALVPVAGEARFEGKAYYYRLSGHVVKAGSVRSTVLVNVTYQ